MSIFLDPRTRMIASSSTYIDICFSLAVHACGNIGMMDSLAARVWPIYLPLLSRLSTSFSIRSDLERISTLSFRLCTLVVRSETRALRSANCSLRSAFNSALRSLNWELIFSLRSSSPPWICWRAKHYSTCEETSYSIFDARGTWDQYILHFNHHDGGVTCVKNPTHEYMMATMAAGSP